MRFQRISCNNPARDGNKPVEEFVGDAGLNEEPRSGGANLARIIENAPCGFGCRSFEIGAVVEDDVRRFAAKLEADALQVALSGILHQQLADGARAGESNHVDVVVKGERLARFCAEARVRY